MAAPTFEEAVAVGTLVPWDRNPRANEEAVPRVAASIRKFGFLAPIVARAADRRILAGHTRWKAARLLGLATVPVRWVECDDAAAAAYALADNRLGEIATWDEQAVGVLVRDLAAVDLDLPEIAGFRLEDFPDPLAAPAEPSPPVPEPEPPAIPVTSKGDVWICGPHRVACGDAHVPGDRARLLRDDAVACVLTDPPYAIYGSSTGVDKDVADDAMIRPFFDSLFRAVFDVLPVFGHAYVNCDWRSWPTIYVAALAAGMVPKNALVWDKGGAGLGSNYSNTYELVGFFAKSPERCAMVSNNPAGARLVYRSNVLRHPRPHGDARQHNAAKPVPLLGELIENSTDPGAVVLDLFGGSGSTLIAAEEKGRRCFTMEEKPGWCDVIVRRWETRTGRKAERLPAAAG